METEVKTITVTNNKPVFGMNFIFFGKVFKCQMVYAGINHQDFFKYTIIHSFISAN